MTKAAILFGVVVGLSYFCNVCLIICLSEYLLDVAVIVFVISVVIVFVVVVAAALLVDLPSFGKTLRFAVFDVAC